MLTIEEIEIGQKVLVDTTGIKRRAVVDRVFYNERVVAVKLQEDSSIYYYCSDWELFEAE